MRKRTAWSGRGARAMVLMCCLLSAALANAPQSDVKSPHDTSSADTATINSGYGQRVVLLHGLARSASSMSKLANALQAAGFTVCNVDYPSRAHSIEVLTAKFVQPAIDLCFGPNVSTHFVTHSLGGIIVRQLAEQTTARIGRVVMLSPPNHGSEVVDKLSNVWGFDLLNGPAGKELGTGNGSMPLKLGPAKFEVGIITGVRSINPVLSTLIPGDDDGKVAVSHAQLEGMRDFLVLRCSHPFIMKSDRAIRQTLHFLRHGAFQHQVNNVERAVGNVSDEPPGDCWD